jgi:hypothetical protein
MLSHRLPLFFLVCSNKPLEGAGKNAKGKSEATFRPDQATLIGDMPRWSIAIDSLLVDGRRQEADSRDSTIVNYSLDRYELKDWRTDSLLRYNARPCTYTLLTKVRHNRRKQYFLDLGQVYYVASLSVNGREVGKRLYAPYLFNVTPYLRNGNNVIEVTVKPSLYNELVKRGLDGDRLFKQLKTTGLAAGGLVGPVRLYEQ